MHKLAKNKATDIRKELLTEVLKCIFQDRLRDLDSLPQKLYPRDQVSYRCCIHRDRYIIRGRIIAILGHSFEDEDETKLLHDYATEALAREKVSEPVLTVIDEACSSCVKENYFVTDACRGCVARPCTVNCPQKAISVVAHKSHIDASKCVGCGMCKSVCPYNAIIYIPVPCEEGCPVGAIQKGKNGKESIDYGNCIYCGMCTRACPFSAIVEKTQVVDVAKRLMGGEEVVALVAPSIVGQFQGELRQLIAALRKLGFTKVVEVAYGADITARKEAEEFADRMGRGDAMMGTSCCPAYLEAVKKHATGFGKYVSHAKTPMSYTAGYAAEKYPGAAIVFIGPCITKKFEGIHDPNVDFVITYEELEAFFKAKSIKTDSCGEAEFDNTPATKFGRGFAVSGGVGAALEHNTGGLEVKKVVIDGLDKAGIQTLCEFGKGAAPGNLIEVMCCKGGCVNGPGVVADPRVAAAKLRKLTEGSE
jgi:[FeFe] hydrogenase (group B1/B3)